MTTTRRALVLIALVAGVLFASGAAAQASYSDTATLTATPTSVSTATVTAPTQVEAKPTCTTTYDATTGTSTTSVTIKVEWWRSNSRGVTGYAINVHPQNGPSYELVRTGPTDEVYQVVDQTLLDSRPRFSITTLTSYRWTAESLRTPVVTC